ncbi:hypothetical protein GGF32_000926 [Allomyces javanicus]|nr:hypothetical protein GGF32_000926 [Allomyces javanicus]
MPRKSGWGWVPIDAEGHESDSAPPPDDLVYDKARYNGPAPTNPQTPLADLLALVKERQVDDERAFAVRNMRDTLPVVPSIIVNGQLVPLPMTTDTVVAQIVAAATRELDPRGSLAFEVDADQVAVPAQDQWELKLANAARHAARIVGCATVPLTMQLLHLLVILPGGRVVRSPATPHNARHFLTAVFPLPSTCVGGQLVVTPDANAAPITFDLTTTTDLLAGTPYVVYRAGATVTREYLPVTSGFRVVLEYAVLWPPNRGSPPTGDSLTPTITAAVAQHLAALHGRGRTFHYLLSAKSVPPGTSTKEFTDTPTHVMAATYLQGIDKARLDVLHVANQTLPETARYAFFFARATRRATHSVVDRAYTLGPTYDVDTWSTYDGADRLGNDPTASTYPVADMASAVNPDRAWLHQLWAGRHRTHQAGTVKNRRTVRTIYRRYVLVAVPSTKLVRFLFTHVGATSAQTWLFARPCNERAWYAEILRGIKLVAKKLAPHEGAAKLVDVAAGFGNTDAVLSVFAGVPDLVAQKPALVASLMAADAVWSAVRDVVLEHLRALAPAEARLAAIAQVMSGLVDRHVPDHTWTFLRDWAADGIHLAPSSTMIQPLANPAAAVIAALARANDVDRVRRALRSAAVDAMLRSGIDVVSPVLTSPTVWAAVRDEVIVLVDAVPPAARLSVCVNAATAARAHAVDETDWTSVLDHALTDLPALTSPEFKQCAQTLWRLVLARSDSEVWAAYLVGEYVRQGMADADKAAVIPLVTPHLPAATRAALAPLACARYAQVKEVADAPLPAKSWVIQGARFPTNNAIQAFLRSNDKEITVTGEFGGIAAARAVAEQVSKNRKGVEAKAHGTGKKAAVTITKVNAGFDDGVKRKREASDEVRRLEGMFGAGVGEAEVCEVPCEVEEVKRVVGEERARNAETYAAERAKVVETERAAAEARELAANATRAPAPAPAPAIDVPVATTAPVVAAPATAAAPALAAVPAAAARPSTAPTSAVPASAPAAVTSLPVPAPTPAAAAATAAYPRVIAPPAIPASLMTPAATTAAPAPAPAAMPWTAHYPPWFPQMYVPPAHPAAAQYIAVPQQMDPAVAHQWAMQYAAMSGGVYAVPGGGLAPGQGPAGHGQGGAPSPPQQQ